MIKGSTRLGFEIKLTNSPKVTGSMKTALEVLGLTHVYVVCHGSGAPWDFADGITAVPAGNLSSPTWLPQLSCPAWWEEGNDHFADQSQFTEERPHCTHGSPDIREVLGR